MNKLIILYEKYSEMILYLFFGVCTTIVNIAVYFICSHLLYFNTFWSTIIAWVISVAFAYITNRIFVFKSQTVHIKNIIKEIVSFVGCRLVSGIVDLLIMLIFVDVLFFPDLIVKLLSNVLVIIFNYIASKYLIFK